jgi:DHA1 family multidrug resistance protein-like MFS transporter
MLPTIHPADVQQSGIQWASTLLGCIAVLMIPILVLFLVFGPCLRQKSRLAPGVGVKRA